MNAITIQNEPLHSGDQTWTMYMDQSDAAILSQRLGAALKQHGIPTEIWGWDHN